MDSASSNRVGDSSRRKRRRPKLQNRGSLAESPLSPVRPKSFQRKRSREEEKEAESEFFQIKGILQEKIEDDRIFYLIDWEDNPQTGERYKPNWEPRENVTQVAIAEWKQKKKDRRKQLRKEGQRQSQNQSPAQSSPYSFPIDSQPIHPRKRQRLDSLGESSSKPPRRVGTASSARFQSVSQEENIELPQKVIKDSYEEELSNNSEGVRVIVRVNEGFDREAYAKYSYESSQPSQHSQHSQPSQPSHPPQSSKVYKGYSGPESERSSQQPRPSPKTPKPRRSPFLWDEDLPTVIPDSQPLPGSSSFVPTATPTSRAELSPRPNTLESDFDTALLETPSRAFHISTDPSIDHLRSEPPSLQSQSLRDAAPESTLRRKGEPEPLDQSSESILDRTPESNPSQLPNSGPTQAQTSEPITQNGNQQDSPRHSSPAVSSRITALPEYSPPPAFLVGRSPWLEEAPAPTEDHPQSQISQSQIFGDSSSQFQTQLPFPSSYQTVSSQVTDNHVTSRPESPQLLINEDTREQLESNGQPRSQDSYRESRDLQPTQISTSSSEATWQAAQVVSPDPRPSGELSSNSNAGSAKVSEAQGSPTNSPYPQNDRTPVISTLLASQIDQSTIVSPLSSQIQAPSGPALSLISRLPPQEQENIIESIEPREEFDSVQTKPSTPSGEANFPSSYGSNIPPRPYPSANTDNMEEGSLSIAEMMARKRALAKEKTVMEQNEKRRAASAIPPSPPVPQISTPLPSTSPQPTPLATESSMLPLREPATDIPMIIPQTLGSPRSSPEAESKTDGLQTLPFGPMEFAVPLPMVSRVRDIYETELKSHRRDIQALNEDEVDGNIIRLFTTIIDKIKMFCDHQSLVELDYSTQEAFSDRDTTRFAENESTKCQFMAGLLKELKSSNEHVVIIVRPGRMRNILEAMCRHYKINYNHPDQPPNASQSQSIESPLQITFISTGQNETETTLSPTSLVVAFDSTFKRGQYPNLRINQRNPNQLTPLVHLVVTHSIEHLELCIDEHYEPLDRITSLINGVMHLLYEMGKLSSEDYPEGEVAGTEVGKYILRRGPDSPWPLLQMPVIEGLPINNDTSPESEGRHTQPQLSRSTTQTHNISSPAPIHQGGFKRPLGFETDSPEASKRQRFTPIPGEQGDRLESGHSRVSETILHPSSNGQPSSTEIGAEPLTTKTPTQEDEVAELLKKVSLLEDHLRTKEVTETELRQLNLRLEARCEDLETSIRESIQPKYQEALNDRGRFEHEITNALVRENEMRLKYEARGVELEKAREHKAAVEAELSAARISLSTSAIPEIAELNKLKDELRTMQTDKDRLQKKITNLQSEIEYTRGHYQTASSSAAEAAVTSSQLEEENAALKIKASDNARRIHEIQAQDEIKHYLQRIEALEAERVEMLKELDKKSEEIKAFLNGRRPTRGTSVPRSPRMGTMSPNVRERPIARVFGSGVGSRGNSPAPGDAHTPHRGTFGEALYADKGSGRWGNHLI